MTGAFSNYRDLAFPHRFNGELLVGTLAGGTPTDPKVAEGWLRSKLGEKDDLIREQVAQVMVDRGVTAEEATELVNLNKHLTGFKVDKEHGLYIEGRQLKAALKEAVSVAVAAGKLEQRGWGNTKKFLTTYLPEHVFVVEDRLYLGVTEASGITQRFVHTYQISGIHYEEYVTDAKISFTVISDHNFSDKEWAMIWLTGEQQGIGASRSQGYGRYTVTKWERQK